MIRVDSVLYKVYGLSVKVCEISAYLWQFMQIIRKNLNIIIVFWVALCVSGWFDDWLAELVTRLQEVEIMWLVLESFTLCCRVFFFKLNQNVYYCFGGKKTSDKFSVCLAKKLSCLLYNLSRIHCVKRNLPTTSLFTKIILLVAVCLRWIDWFVVKLDCTRFVYF